MNEQRRIFRSIRQILPLNHVFKKKSESHYHTYCIKHRQHKKPIKLYCLICWNCRESWDTKHIRVQTWSQLSAAHCDLVFDLSSFFAHHNMFDAFSYSFSAAVQLTDLSSISDTLLDHVCWINLIVMSHLCDLLNDNNAVRNAYLHNWIIMTRQAIKLNEKK
jgi:hypothetical protein